MHPSRSQYFHAGQNSPLHPGLDAASIVPGTLVERGNELLEQGELVVAEVAFEKAVAPLCAEEYIFCGQRLLARGALDVAKVLFLAARERASRA